MASLLHSSSKPCSEETPPEEPVVVLGLRAVLQGTNAEELGFPPERIPHYLRVKLPLSLIVPQLSSGHVTVRIQDLRAGVNERFRPAFSKASAELLIDVPQEELLAALPEHLRTSSTVVRTGRLCRPPKTGAPPPVLPPADAKPSAPAVSPPDSFTGPSQPAPAEFEKPGTPLPEPEWEKPEFSAPPPCSPASNSWEPDNGDDLGDPFCAADLCQEPPLFPLNPSSPSQEPETPPSPPSREEDPFGSRPLTNRLLLNALFGPESPRTLAGALTVCGSLPGVSGCVLLTAGHTLSGGSPPADECLRLTAEASVIIPSLSTLRNSLQCPRRRLETEGFTSRCGEKWRTFFVEKDMVLAAWHDLPDFPPGVREKLILVLAELAAAA